MSTINVNSSVADQFYRYKMPRLIAKVEGKGNGIKTVIVNMVEIAKSLSRPPTYPTKYFGCELGAQTYFDFKNERFIVNGSHDSSKLQSLLDGFIKKFVLCVECGNPETNLVVKSNFIKQRCIACGHQEMVDMRHKLTTFIVKNPPDQDPASTPSKKEKIKAKKDSKKKDSGTEPESPAGQSKSAQEEMAAKRVSGEEVDAPPAVHKDEDEDDWAEDVTDEAIKQRMESLSDAAKGLALTDELDKTPQERLDMFYQYVKEKVESSTLTGADKDILTEAERLEIKDKAPLILAELLLSEKILSELKEHRILFLRFNHNNQKAQKYMMGGLEQLIGKVHKDALLPKVPHIFKALYDMDIMDEEVLIDWSQKVSKKYVSKEIAQEIHNKAAPFIKWLQEAEETESEEENAKEGEEEEEEDLAVVYSTTEKIGTHKVQDPNAVEDEDDDLDIDAI